jgi:hypothetical protein
MKYTKHILPVAILLLLGSCISQFVPQTTEDKDLLVVEGLITDQQGVNTIKLSRSLPLGVKSVAKPVKGSTVTITDDLGNTFTLKEMVPGTYVTDATVFQGKIGQIYTLHISTNAAYNNASYQSYPMEMKAVPPIDSIYYEKVAFELNSDGTASKEGCQIFFNTHDPTNQCKYYRWEYSETWEIHLPYSVPNNICWVTNNSDVINIKNLSTLQEDRVTKYPINLISYVTDRLSTKYSIQINQYSLSEDEYLYWEKLQNVSQQVGGLYDIIPAAIPSNVYSLSDPNEKVLGYFSVSGNSSKRIFIKDRFVGIMTPYTNEACIADTVFGHTPVPISAWVIINNQIPPYNVYTYTKGCADCTVRGTKIEPSYWENGK